MPPFDDDSYLDAVFDLCGYDRGDGCEGLAYVFHPIDDVPWIRDHQAIHDLGVAVATLVRARRRVVVNCMAGLNRSGLLVGRALIELGRTPSEAVAAVRAARGPNALSNPGVHQVPSGGLSSRSGTSSVTPSPAITWSKGADWMPAAPPWQQVVGPRAQPHRRFRPPANLG